MKMFKEDSLATKIAMQDTISSLGYCNKIP